MILRRMDPVLASIPALPCILSCEIKKGYWEKKEVDSKIELAGMGIGRHRQAPEISFFLTHFALRLTTYVFPCTTWDIIPVGPGHL